jgi:hypothetical protein
MRTAAGVSTLLSIALAGVTLCGCGGGGKQGKSLTQQFQDALKVSDTSLRARRLIAVAEKQKTAGDVSGMTTSLGAAKEAAAAVTDPVSQANTLILVAGAYARLDQSTDQVKLLLRDAGKSIDRIEALDAKVLPLADLAAATSQHLQNADAAAFHLKAAEQAAEKIELPSSRVRALGRIGGAYGKAKLDSEAERVMSQAGELAESQSDPRVKADCQAEMAAAWHALGNSDQAQADFTAAEQTAATVADKSSQAYALLNIAQKARAAKQAALARKLLLQAQGVAEKVEDGSIRGPLIEEIHGALKKL